jgi:hypothetical protein
MIMDIRPLSLIPVGRAFYLDIATDLSSQQQQHLLMSVEDGTPNYILLVTPAIYLGTWSLMVASCLHTALWESRATQYTTDVN